MSQGSGSSVELWDRLTEWWCVWYVGVSLARGASHDAGGAIKGTANKAPCWLLCASYLYRIKCALWGVCGCRLQARRVLLTLLEGVQALGNCLLVELGGVRLDH